MFARQVSARGGDVGCELKGSRVLMSGQATLLSERHSFSALKPITREEETMQEIDFYLVDAFSDKTFGGNAAAVCPLEEWLPDETLLKNGAAA